MTLISSAFANTFSVYRFDDVDTIMANGKTILVEDLRDGFTAVKGVQVNEESVTISSESKALILLRNSAPKKVIRHIQNGCKARWGYGRG